MSKMFVHYSGTVSEFSKLSNIADYNNKIVFIKGGADGDGAAIYTHGEYYGNVKEALAALETKVNGLKYFTSIKAGDTTASATGKDGVITFNATDPALVSVDVDSHGVNIGLSKTFTDSVASNTSNIAAEVTRATEAESKIRTDLGLKTDAADAEGSAFARIAKLVADLNAMTGGNGSIAEQIKTAIEDLDVAASTGDYVKSIAQEDGKIVPVVGTFNFDEKGAAATAEQNAKDYADSLADDYDPAGAAAAVADDLADHEADTVAHVTADERTAWNAAKSAIDTFLKDANMTEDAVDTLKELQTYMTTDGAAAAALVGRVAALEEIDHDAYKAADEATLASAKSYADGLASNYDAAGAADDALADAKAYVDGKVDGKFDAAGSAATAKSEAIADANAYTNTAIEKLDVEDAPVENQFVTAVSETDGKISVTRSAISASQIGITNTEADAFAAGTANVQDALTELASFWAWEEL